MLIMPKSPQPVLSVSPQPVFPAFHSTYSEVLVMRRSTLKPSLLTPRLA